LSLKIIHKVMKNLFGSSIGFLRFIAFFEGLSLIILLFLGMPMKYIFGQDFIVKYVGMAHGFLFMAFVLLALLVHVLHEWKFSKTTWKVLLSSMVPFGTFYIDAKILKPQSLKK
jgi:integral membrane protein